MTIADLEKCKTGLIELIVTKQKSDHHDALVVALALVMKEIESRR